MVQLAVFDAPGVDLHHVPPGFPEVPARLAGIRRRLSNSPHGIALELGASTPRIPEAELIRAIERVHPFPYAERLRRAVERGDGLFDTADNPLSTGTFHAALTAAELAVRGARFAAAGARTAVREASRAFCLTRPPGHHAERATAMGFCYFNNVALAAEELLATGIDRIDRVAIVDIDVHHGNGTQHHFEDRENVFFVSLHQHPFYPGTGLATETGQGEGAGTTLNVPLPAGTGGSAYQQAFETLVVPALRAFRPGVLLVSAGFDAWRADPLGGFRLEVEDFRRLGGVLAGLADELAEGRGLAVLEGGYDLDALPELVGAFLDGWGA